jgi:hypothetical protein
MLLWQARDCFARDGTPRKPKVLPRLQQIALSAILLPSESNAYLKIDGPLNCGGSAEEGLSRWLPAGKNQ